ncbi:hypothetical protein AHAS_Ahas09G0166300 [Arachis hypogaea]
MYKNKAKEKQKVDDSETYGWVDDDVKIQGSLFVDGDSVAQVDVKRVVKEGSGVEMELLPCVRSERIFHRRVDFEFFFYMYSCVLEELRVKLPFTDFECKVSEQLNYAPSQFHPNGWAFLRCFEILMEYLEIKPSLKLFFSLF